MHEPDPELRGILSLPSEIHDAVFFLSVLRSKSGTLISGRAKGIRKTREQVRAGRRNSELTEGPQRPCPWSLTDLGLNLAATIYEHCDSALLMSSPETQFLQLKNVYPPLMKISHPLLGEARKMKQEHLCKLFLSCPNSSLMFNS